MVTNLLVLDKIAHFEGTVLYPEGHFAIWESYNTTNGYNTSEWNITPQGNKIDMVYNVPVTEGTSFSLS
jgi:hypothetical protein